MFDESTERAALVSLLTQDQKMRWASVRRRLVTEEVLPSALIADTSELQRGAEVLRHWVSRARGASFYTYLDAGYPAQLATVWDFPPFVFVKGDEVPLHSSQEDLGVSIVGSRTPKQLSLDATQKIANGLIAEGVTIVSGLAEGIDQAAHRSALAAGSRTVGVIGTGIDRYYPRSSEPLQKQMEQGAGMVLSQFVPGSHPTKYSFPMRNATMSAYSTATIIVEASEKSGTRHQAAQAIKHGRPLILLRQVAHETTWGRSLAEDPLVDAQVARTPEHAIELAFDVFERGHGPELLIDVA